LLTPNHHRSFSGDGESDGFGSKKRAPSGAETVLSTVCTGKF
jgi:hypothetical protein